MGEATAKIGRFACGEARRGQMCRQTAVSQTHRGSAWAQGVPKRRRIHPRGQGMSMAVGG